MRSWCPLSTRSRSAAARRPSARSLERAIPTGQPSTTRPSRPSIRSGPRSRTSWKWSTRSSGPRNRSSSSLPGTRSTHLPGYHHVRHTAEEIPGGPSSTVTPPAGRPTSARCTAYLILTRSEVELLNSYIACQACAPTLDHQRKEYFLNARPMSILSIAVHHIGRAVATPEGEDLGFMVSHQRIVTADGIRSIMTTTDRVVETDGEEKYLIAPRAEL